MKDTILLLDVMSTIVYDPFAVELPAHFGVSLDELLEDKDPTAWLEFERDEIDEHEFYERFFSGERQIDGPAMKAAMREHYRWLEGMESLVGRLSDAGYEMHTLSNYPVWYQMIEEKLSLSRYLDWTFVSCKMGVRKPDPDAYMIPARELGVPPSRCLFVDDRGHNCKGAAHVGMSAIKFEEASQLERDLREHGLDF